MLSDRGDEPADSRILEGFTLEDLDRPSLQQYRQRFSSLKPTHPWLSENDQGFLVKLGGWRRDRKTGLEGLTVSGILMFGTDETIRDVVPGYHVDFREKLDPAVRWTDRVTQDGTWTGNLFQFYLRVIQKLSAGLKIPFQLESDLFRKSETIVHEAIREALVNALVHADYQGQGGIVVERYQNRFEFSNPGTLLVSFDQLGRGGVSECRNKALQTMFTMIGAAEKAGSGVDKIRQGWKSQHWRAPLVQEQMKPDRVRWLLPMSSLIPKESEARLKAMFGHKFDFLKRIEVQAMVTADLEGEVTNDRLRQMTGEHAWDLTKLLQSLVARNYLTQESSGRWTKYRLPSAEGSLHNGGSSLHNEGSSLHNEGPEFDPVITDLARPAREKKRLPPNEMKKIILTLCQGRYLTTAQLAEILDRNLEGVRSRLIKPLVDGGFLRLRFPDKPNRADQAYQSVEKSS